MSEPYRSRSEWLTVRDIAALLIVGEDTVRRWIRTERINAKFFGGRTGYRVRRADLEIFLRREVERAQKRTKNDPVTAVRK